MRHPSTILLLCAWLLASGAQWDLVQSFAWARMFVTYSRTMPLAEAVQKTFQADNLCGVCEFVANARTRDTGAPETETGAFQKLHAGKYLFAPPPSPLTIVRVADTPDWSPQTVVCASRTRPAPPCEPPRAA